MSGLREESLGWQAAWGLAKYWYKVDVYELIYLVDSCVPFDNNVINIQFLLVSHYEA